MSEAMPSPTTEAPSVPAAPQWDPFQLMDRMDEEALRRELDGVAATDLVYVVKEGSQEVVGLSKTGVDECCMALVSQGQVIREESLQYELIGETEDREALFKVTAARFAVSPEGQEVRLDQVIGVKRQPLYYEPAQLDLDSRVPGRKYRGRTYRDLLEFTEGRDYLAWMAETFGESELRDFLRRVLAGEDVVAQRGRQLQSPLVRGRRHEGGKECPLPAHPRQRPGAGDRLRAAEWAGSAGGGADLIGRHLRTDGRAHRPSEPGRPVRPYREAGRFLSAARRVIGVLR